MPEERSTRTAFRVSKPGISNAVLFCCAIWLVGCSKGDTSDLQVYRNIIESHDSRLETADQIPVPTEVERDQDASFYWVMARVYEAMQTDLANIVADLESVADSDIRRLLDELDRTYAAIESHASSQIASHLERGGADQEDSTRIGELSGREAYIIDRMREGVRASAILAGLAEKEE